MTMKMTINEIESKLRQARRNVFSDDAQVSEQAAKDIATLKALASPFWAKRETPESSYARVMWL